MAFSCPRCGNTRISLTFIHQGQRICRRCLGFQGQSGEGTSTVDDPHVHLQFKLTPDQSALSHRLVEVSRSRDVVVEAVCGARWLSQGKNV